MSYVEEVFKGLKRASNFYDTTITIAMSTTSTHCSKPSGVLRVTFFFSKTGNLERHLVTCSDRVKHKHPKKFYNLKETLFEKLDTFNIPLEVSKNCSRTWQYLALSPFVSRKRTPTKRLRLQSGSGSMCPYQFLSRQT